MFKAKIKKVKRDKELELDKEFLDVELEISDDNRVFTRKLAFPIGSSSDAIKAEVKKYVETFNADAKLAIEDKKKEERDKKINEVIEDLEGETI